MKVIRVSDQNSIGQKQIKKNNNPAFGMIIKMQPSASELAKSWFPKPEYDKLILEISALKTKSGDEIFVWVYGDMKKRILKFLGQAGNNEVFSIRMSKHSKNNTFKPNGVFTSPIENLMATLKGIKNQLDRSEVSSDKEVFSNIETISSRVLNKKESNLVYEVEWSPSGNSTRKPADLFGGVKIW